MLGETGAHWDKMRIKFHFSGYIGKNEMVIDGYKYKGS